MDDDTSMAQGVDGTIPSEAVAFLNDALDAEGFNRALAKQDISFSHGEQWPPEIQNSRTLEGRPFLTINKTNVFIRSVCNQQRQQRPRIKVDPVSGGAKKKLAEVIGGIIRHIETLSNADMAYDTAFEQTARGGWGYWRVIADYSRPDSFDQDLFIVPIVNQFSVYFDRHSVQPDGRDARKCLITDTLPRYQFKLEYPNAQTASFHSGGLGDTTGDWITKDDIRIAELYVIREKQEDLLKLSNGTTVWGDQVNDLILKASGLKIVRIRKSMRREVHWYKLTAIEVLEHRILPGRYIPVVRVLGNRLIEDGRQKLTGLVRDAVDPQRMYNYWRSAQTESIALAPKAKWLMADGQDEGFEVEWQQANVSARAVLHYKATTVDDKVVPPPTRLQPEPPPVGIMEAAQSVSDDLQSTLGIVDPAMRIEGPVSGKALNSQAQQSEMSTFNFYDNLTRAISFTGTLLLDLIPHYYDTQRIVRVIGEDGRPDQVTINEVVGNEIVNDVTIGEYDVVMDTGPGYNTKRQEGVEAMAPMFASDPELRKIAGDIFFRMQDWPGSEQIADRLAAANPLAQIDEKSDIPPQVQAKMAAMAQQIEQMGAAIQEKDMLLKSRMDVEQFRGHVKLTDSKLRVDQAAMSDILWSQEERQQFQQVARSDEAKSIRDNLTKHSIAELNGAIDLMVAHVQAREDNKRSEAEHGRTMELAKLAKPEKTK